MTIPFMGCYVIVRDGAATIKTLLNSIAGVFDEVVFVDTGSTDDTRKIIADHYRVTWDGPGRTVSLNTNGDGPARVVLASFDWIDDFSAARNFSYSLGTAKWRFYLDADDDATDFQRKLRPTLERTDREFPNVNCISIGYRYTTDGGMVQDKLGRGVRWDGGWSFRDPIHEHLERLPGRGGRDISKYTDMLVLHQHAPQAKLNHSFERNVRITERWYNDPKTTPHKKALAAYYLAIAADGIDQHEPARKYFREAIDGLGRINLSSESLCRWARMELKLGNTEKAISLAAEAISKAPELPDGLSALGVALSIAGEQYRAASVFDTLKAQPKPPLESHHDVIWLDGLVNVHAAQAYYRTGRIDDAIKALDAIPKEMINHPEVHSASQEIRNSLQKTEGYKRLHALWEYLIWDTEPLKAKRLLEELVPAAISDSPQVKQLLRQTEAKMPQMKDWAAYQRTYAAIPDLPYHVPDNHRDWTLQQGRARLVAQWASAQPKEGRNIEVLAVGIQDGIIEGQMMENCPRIHLTACDVAPQASKGINELIARFPGRVKTHQVVNDHYDWFADRNDKYDAIIFFEVIEHLPEGGDKEALELFQLHLRPEGTLFLSTPIAANWVESYLSDMKSPRPWWHVRAHNPSSLWRLCQETGFTGSLVGLGTEGLFLGTLRPSMRYLGEGPEFSIYVYPLGSHGFDPFSAKQGHLGGSEESVIHLSAALAKQGCRVTVFTDSPKRKDTTFVHDGVMWRSLSEFAPEALTGTLLVWRAPALAANFKQQNPRLKCFVWAHDTNYEASPEAYARADGTIVLSKFHAEAIRQLDGYQGPFTQAANGIVPEEFPQPDESKRNGHAAIYASAPNRGLEFLLDAWPRIRAVVSDATLKVYYSWTLTEQMMEKRPELKAELGPLLAKLRQKFVELKDHGVTYVGGVSHPVLHEAYRTSGIWAYPVGASGFNEIHCISALKAQASGCIPVIVPLGAMSETCQFGVHVELGEGLMDRYVKAVVDTMKQPREMDRDRMRAWALEQSWDKAAEQFVAASKTKNERVTIYAGAFIRKFDGTGSGDGKPLGGSEVAVIAMAHALAERGKQVFVYCALPEGGPRPDGTSVRWLDSSKFSPAGPHGTLLAWRCPNLVPKLKGNGYPVILWLMDPHYRAAPYDYAEADDVVFLTETHKKIIAGEDGYDGGGSVVHVGLPELPEIGSVVRDPKAVMWATSPDRGLLEFLCETWPQVLKEVPDAKLHIFYGLEPLELNGKKVLADNIRAAIEGFKSTEVTYHGGVPDAVLYEWYQVCGVIVAPSVGFEETQSISICKALALGCTPVVNDVGCFREVLTACGGGIVATNDGIGFPICLVKALKEPYTDAMRQQVAARARAYFSVESMAEKMLKVIEGVQC